MGRRQKNGQRRAAKVGARERRLRREEARREEHIRLVAEREGDPRFVQQERTAAGRRVSWSSESAQGREISGALERRLDASRERYGREPGPEDSVFFDPDAEEPTPIRPEAVSEALAEVAGRADLDDSVRAFVLAGAELGYLLTTENQHLFSATEVQAWEDAVERHRESLGLDDDLEDDDLEDDEATQALFTFVRDRVRGAVGSTLATEDPQIARAYAAGLADADDHVAEEGLDEQSPGTTLAFAALVDWLVSARERTGDARLSEMVLAWVADHLGPSGSSLERAAGLLGGRDGGATVNELVSELGDDLIPVLVWLVSGVVAVAGAGDTAWLDVLDEPSDE